MVRGHDGSKSVAVGDVHDYILLEFEKRVYNSTLQQFRNNDSLPDLNVTDIRPGRFRNTGRSRDEFYGLLRNNFNLCITRNEVDFVKNEFYQADNPIYMELQLRNRKSPFIGEVYMNASIL